MRKFVRLMSVLFLLFAFVKQAASQNINFITTVIGHPLVPDLMTRAGAYGWKGFQPHAGPWWADEHADILDAQSAGMTWIMAWISHDSVWVHDWRFVHEAIDSGKKWGVTCFYLDDCFSAHPDSLTVADVDSVAHWVHAAGFKLAAAESNLQRVQHYASLGGYDSVDYIVPYHYMDSTASQFQTFLEQMRAAIPNKPFIPQLGYHADGGNSTPFFFYDFNQLGDSLGGNGIIEVAEQYADLGLISYYTYFGGEDSTWKLNYFYKLTNYLQQYYGMSGTPAPVGIQPNQKLQSGSDVGSIGVWNGSSFVQHAPGDTAFLTRTSTQTIQADESVYSSEKYNNWTRNSVEEPNILNYHQFTTIEPYDSVFTSHFIPTAGGDTVQANDVGGTGEATSVGFSDPWFVDSAYQSYESIKRNQGTSAPLISRASPFYPNMSTSYGGDQYNGVFLNQQIVSGSPYYTLSFPSQSVTVGGTSHNIQFINWTASGATLQNPNCDTTAVVFTSSSAAVTANVKATQLSNDATTFSDNGQRKFIRTPNGFLHCVYSDGGHIWYEYSTDNGTTWHLGKNWLATGPYGPLDGTAGGKDPSIDYDPQTNHVVIVWQQKSSNGYYTVQYMTFWPDDYVQNTYSINSYGTLYTDGSDAYSSVNANPNIAVNATASGGTEFWVLSLEKYHWYITAGDTVFGGIDVLWGTFNGGNTLDISQDNYAGYLPTHITGTNYASVNATIYGNKTNAGGSDASGWTFPLAWQQNPGIHETQIKYTQLTLYYDVNSLLALHQDPVTQLSQSNTPDNHNPSIIGIPGSGSPTYAVCWLLDFTGLGQASTTRVCYTSGNNTSLTYLGSLPQSCSLNVSSDNSVSYFVWSQGSAPWSDYVVSTSNLGSATALSSTGDGMQLSNGAGKSDMCEISYLSNGSAPYAITPAIGLGSVMGLQSTEPAHLSDSSRTVAGAPVQAFDSRGVVIGNDSASLQYLFGDITVDGESVPFVTIPDTFKSRNLSDVNQLLKTQPFSLISNSKVTFGEFSVVADSGAMSSVLGDTGYVSFKAELINASTEKVLGTIKEWKFGSKDLSKFSQVTYNLNTGGYSGKNLMIGITASTNIKDPVGIPVNDYSTEIAAASASAQSVAMQQANLVTTYSLSQNYPNPFNPTTVIDYTIPKDSHVTLKIYDVLGQEVETLVNEDQNVGRYQVQFNGSRFSSGVYFYRLVAGSRVITKKMLLLK